MGKVGIVGLICCGVSTSLIVVSCALPYWYQNEYTYEMETRRDVAGLWMFCRSFISHDGKLCEENSSVEEYVLAVRAFVLMGLFLVATATVLGFVGIFVIKENKKISLTAGAISIAAGICMLIGAIVFAGRTSYFARGIFVQYHIGFALAIAAGVVSIVAGILLIRGRSSVESQTSSQHYHTEQILI